MGLLDGLPLGSGPKRDEGIVSIGKGPFWPDCPGDGLSPPATSDGEGGANVVGEKPSVKPGGPPIREGLAESSEAANLLLKLRDGSAGPGISPGDPPLPKVGSAASGSPEDRPLPSVAGIDCWFGK